MLKARILHLNSFLRSCVDLLGGLIEFYRKGVIPPRAYQKMIRLFCMTGGRSNTILSKIMSLRHRKYNFSDKSNIFKITPEELKVAVEEIKNNGYYVFQNKLDEGICNRLLDIAINNSAEVEKNGKVELLKYNADKPEAVKYQFPSNDLVNNETVQRIIGDEALALVAQSYLDCPPIIDIVTMWWSTNFSKKADKKAAQYYHFDMDRIKWLKFFFYVKDVEPENGPHVFVKGSHKDKGIPQSLLSKGYARLTDEEVKKHYAEEDIIEFSGKRGTIIAEDTRGLHKGQHLRSGDRLIFQVQYCSSMFGGQYSYFKLSDVKDVSFKRNIQKFPRVFSQFDKG